ncbi:hypothetical protein [Mongoliibacter ruber]|uniref:Uncharacterized protein n=1 Tax=Mongoliibacter ruber TaxID=1750599 RepID=A0A2T0WV54_9BACT|nr:hypothetical protein [Mongoliibacter ruber]PRY90560.1 hypothetical protein CLW00_101222 [Mongoliibacter ruber]
MIFSYILLGVLLYALLSASVYFYFSDYKTKVIQNIEDYPPTCFTEAFHGYYTKVISEEKWEEISEVLKILDHLHEDEIIDEMYNYQIEEKHVVAFEGMFNLNLTLTREFRVIGRQPNPFKSEKGFI